MQIFVDADACPVKELIIQIARVHRIAVTMVLDTSHEYYDGYSTVITVDKGKDSVDIALINRVKKDDIVITQDYGVAAMAIGKGAKALNQNGLIYSNENIDQLLFQRFLGQKIRRSGGRTKGPGKRAKEDDDRFVQALSALL